MEQSTIELDMTKPLIFNELTCLPLAVDHTDCYNRVEQFIKTYKASETHDFKGIRFQQVFDDIFLKDGYSLRNFCSEHSKKIVAQVLLSTFHYPFIDEKDAKEETRFIQNNFFILRNEDRLKVIGLAAVYLYDTIGIGFQSEEFWNDLRFDLQIEGSEVKQTNIVSVSQPEHFETQIFLDWKQQNCDIQLEKCDIPPSAKHISLRDDHGKDILQKFSNQLINSPYVIKIVNSLPFNPRETKFIHKITETGLVEIVLTDTDKGLGLVVQTTGRNKRETEKIASLLEEKFSK